MRNVTICFVALIISANSYAQNKTAVELDLFARYDRHAHYTTRYFDRSFTDDIKLWGKSFGSNIRYRQNIFKRVNATAGAGYYMLRIDKIKSPTQFNTISNKRVINYKLPDSTKPLVSTSHYRYHNFSLTAGLCAEGRLNKKWIYTIGADYTSLYTFRQVYYIDWNDTDYRRSVHRRLGWGITTSVGLKRNCGENKMYINPKLMIPVYQKLYGDEVFGETNSVEMVKWMHGIGLSVSFGRYF
jgi:hypothetical protein